MTGNKDLLIGGVDEIGALVEDLEHVGRYERTLDSSFLGRLLGTVVRRAEKTAKRFAAERGADVVVVSGCYYINGDRAVKEYKVWIDLFRYSSNTGPQD